MLQAPANSLHGGDRGALVLDEPLRLQRKGTSGGFFPILSFSLSHMFKVKIYPIVFIDTEKPNIFCRIPIEIVFFSFPVTRVHFFMHTIIYMRMGQHLHMQWLTKMFVYSLNDWGSPKCATNVY